MLFLQALFIAATALAEPEARPVATPEATPVVSPVHVASPEPVTAAPEPGAGATPAATPAPVASPEPVTTATPEPEVGATPAATPAESPAPVESPGAATPEATWDPEARRAPRPGVAGGLALLFPGLGHWYVGETGRGAVFFAAEAAELGAAVTVIATSGWDPDNPADTRNQRALLPLAWLQNTHLLGVYDAWRIARVKGGREVPTPDTARLLLAPVDFRHLKRPAVTLPLAVVWAAGIGASYAAYRDGSGEATLYELPIVPVFSREVPRSVGLATALGYYGTTFYAVGIGEEAVFRGVIQTSLEDRLGPFWGWLTASVFFGALHAFNGQTPAQSAVAVAVTTTLGGYLGWMYQRDGYDLSAATFMHTWYNVGIGLTIYLLDPENQPFSAGISIPF